MTFGALSPRLRIALPASTSWLAFLAAMLASLTATRARTFGHVATVMAVESLGSACEAQQDSGVSTTPALAPMAGALAAMIGDCRNVVDAADDRANARGCKLDRL